MFARNPKYPGTISSSAGMLTAGRPRRLPMASAISRNGMPPSSTACQNLPAGAFSGVAGDALLLRERDQHGEEAGIGRAVHDVGNPHDRRPHSPLGQVDHGGFHDIADPEGALVLIAD